MAVTAAAMATAATAATTAPAAAVYSSATILTASCSSRLAVRAKQRGAHLTLPPLRSAAAAAASPEFNEAATALDIDGGNDKITKPSAADLVSVPKHHIISDTVDL